MNEMSQLIPPREEPARISGTGSLTTHETVESMSPQEIKILFRRRTAKNVCRTYVDSDIQSIIYTRRIVEESRERLSRAYMINLYPIVKYSLPQEVVRLTSFWRRNYSMRRPLKYQTFVVLSLMHCGLVTSPGKT